MTPKPKIPPPPIISFEDRVLLEYALLNHSVGFNRGHALFFVDGKEIGPVPCLAICKDKDSEGFHVYYCDSEWKPVGFSPSWASIEKAKHRAESIYPGSASSWIRSEYTEQDAQRFIDEQGKDERCSFCGKRPFETSARFFQSAHAARICEACIAQFNRKLRDRPASVD